MRDPYEALGVKADASQADIKKAYRKLAKQYHPDSTGGDKSKEERFKEVSTAYDIVGDPEKRTKYDTMRKQGFSGFPGATAEGGPSIQDLGELFAQMFGGGGGARGGRGGGGPRVQYRVYNDPSGGASFSSVFGSEMPFDTPFGFGGGGRPRPAAPPRTRPAKPSEKQVKLSDGQTAVQRGHHVYSDVRLDLDQAVLGTVASVATIDGKASVKIPAGTSSGVKLRLRGKGAHMSSGERGDHFVTVQIRVPKGLDDEAKRLITQFMARVRGAGESGQS